MFEDRNEAGRFIVGNESGGKRTRVEWVELFEKMLIYAMDNKKVYSYADIRVEFKIPRSTWDRKTKKIEEVKLLNEMINDIIISRINHGGLTNELNATLCIWRMKQLGEIDSRDNNVNHSGSVDGVNEHKVIFEDYTSKKEDKPEKTKPEE